MWLDNFVIGHDVGDALSLAEQTWRPKFKAFEAVKAAEKKQKERERADKRRERCAYVCFFNGIDRASRM